jgi:solute carrier family 9 (sodium/hydrogen exchanger), member 8
VNDAVAILIYKAVQEMIISESRDGESVEEVVITFSTIGKTFLNFVYVSFFSILLGLVIGLISAVISKRMTSIKGHVVKEVFLIILIGYLSYIIGEATGLSAIMSLFVCGVTMSHYTFHNVSKEAQAGSVVTINTLGHATEAFLFIYLGLGIFTIDQETFEFSATLYIVIGSFFA